MHRTVQILVTIYIWNCKRFIPLNNIERIATKAGQYATGVNNAGDVSGFYVDTAGVNHGFLLHNGVVRYSIFLALPSRRPSV